MKRWLVPSAAIIGLVVLPASVLAANDVETAIKNGVAYLWALQQDDGTWPHQDIGATALAGLTLLECGVPPDHRSVQRAAEAVRREGILLTHTYSLALTLLFLDALGDPRDAPLIQSLGARLLRGQLKTGGWTYSCPRLEKAEIRRLVAALEPPANPPRGAGPAEPKPLPKDLEMALNRIKTGESPLPQERYGDNSNTQFATLAIWVARRHGVAVKKAIAQVGRRFRTSQTPSGGWAYVLANPTATMTCAGLLGLAIAQGSANEASYRADFSKVHKDLKGAKPRALPDPLQDQAVVKGLEALESVLGAAPGPGAIAPPDPGVMTWAGERDFYFWWSVERVAVAYDLPTIGKKDWYAIGTRIVLPQQREDGRWQGKYPQGGADTCFALLFLRKANLARDLTYSLRGKVPDPGRVSFQAQGLTLPEAPKKDEKIARGADQRKPAQPPADPHANAPAAPAIDLDLPDPRARKTAPATEGNGAGPDAEAARLADRLVNASADEQNSELERLKEARGPQYTAALARAIPRLQGAAKARARDALAERLARMTAGTLRERLRDREAEVRRAAALACAMKDEKTHVSDLIPLIEDPESPVVLAARAALKDLTGQDFGPAASANRAERAEAMVRWKEWWKKQTGK
jgi:hypothetical protein